MLELNKANPSMILMAALSVWSIGFSVSGADASSAQEIEALFSPGARNQLVLDIEAAIANAQAEEGVIPGSAAREITEKAHIQYASEADIAEEYEKVRHRMVALLNVWKRSLDGDAGDYVHYGVTTVDIYDTVKILQLNETIELLVNDMRALEADLIALALQHKQTPMIGRTLGQHALPITFGKKVSVWAAMNRRNIDRLKEVQVRLRRLGVLKGAVGTHLGLGPEGVAIEKRVARSLGLSQPDPADWHGARDVFAEYALVLGLIAKSYGAIGSEVFLLQMTDIGEVHERRPASAIGSSAMPHKRNPSRSEALIHYGRTIPRKAEVLLDDVENAFERDNTSRPNRVLEEISIEAGAMLRDAQLLISRLEIDQDAMIENLDKTDGMVTAQRIVLFVSPTLGREQAEQKVRKAASRAIDENISFRNALIADSDLAPLLSADVDRLLDPKTYLGLTSEQVDLTVARLREARKLD